MTGGRDLRGDAQIQRRICDNSGLTVHQDAAGESVHRALEIAGQPDLVVDALFGTGLTRPLEGSFASLVEALNAVSSPCVAVDLPSGLNGSSHQVMGPGVQADLTVTFAAPKIAHILLPAAASVGEVVVADLGIPADLIAQAAGDLYLSTDEDFAGCLAPRSRTGHKGDYGHAVVLGGSLGKAGAVILAARAAVRSGAGLVTAAVPAPLTPTVDLGSVESMTLSLPSLEPGRLATAAAEEVAAFLGDKAAVAIGPGLGIDEETVAAVRKVVVASEIPVVLDADGLNAFADAVELLAECPGPLVLTPHPGELARLLGSSVAEIQADRLANARAAARVTGAIVVLKGAQTLVAEPSGRVVVNATGNPGMASGGTGDVLTGLLVGLLAQGVAPATAARIGVWTHGLAGDRVRQRQGELGLSAGDVVDELPLVLRELEV
jgi:NAD(P)H-hydrate epimerase